VKRVKCNCRNVGTAIVIGFGRTEKEELDFLAVIDVIRRRWNVKDISYGIRQ
jgi:hypothetical protein